MRAWSKDQGVQKDDMLTLFGDPKGDLTRLLGMELTHAGPLGKGLHGRCKRFVMLLDDGVVKAVSVAEKEDDPAGDDFPEKTLVKHVLDNLC